MKKKTTLMTILIAIGGLSVYSQTLQNTTWAVYHPDGTSFRGYYHFGTDTMFYSSDNISYSIGGHIFQEGGNNFTITDYSGCCNETTGQYTFLIENDTLKFTLVSDPMCDGRAGELTTYHWIIIQPETQNQTGIQNINLLPPINLYPNPFSTQTTLPLDKFLENAILTVDNSYGQTVKQIKNISGQTVILSRDNLPSGLYFVRLTQDSKVIATKKLLIAD